MLPNLLNTNEVKDRNGTEVEFQRIDTTGRTTEYAQLAETPAYPRRINIRHREVGSGTEKRRQSQVRFSVTKPGGVDSTKAVTPFVQVTAEYPVGNSTSSNDLKDLLAHMVTFFAYDAANALKVYDGTSNGSSVILDGSL
jgi:hypothetical protein